MKTLLKRDVAAGISLLALLWAVGFCPANAAEAAPRADNLLVNGDFERADAGLSRDQQPGAWIVYGLTAPDVKLSIAKAAGRNNSRGLQYHRSEQSKANVHVDQIVAVQKNTIYEVSAFVRGDGDLRPILSVAQIDWKLLAVAICPASQQWTEVRLAFDSQQNDRVRLEWFPGATGKLYTAAPGSSCLDDVAVHVLPNPPESLQSAFRLMRPKSDEEILLPRVGSGHAPGRPEPLRSIVCRAGVLQYDDGGEVALWGVNVQTALSWEYNGRLKRSGVPLEAAALKRVTAENLDQIALIQGQVIRAHLLPSDFTDRDGNLVDTVFLDVLDDLIAQCGRRGIYVYVTLINDMQTYYRRDSFMAGGSRQRWLFDPSMVAHLEHYIQQLLNHPNRYTGRPYRDEPAIALFEVINEPEYLDYPALMAEPACRPYREAFQRWCDARGIKEFAETCFHTYRYELVRRVVDGLARAIRQTGSRKPVVWNLNWPGMIGSHEDVFQAVADSSVDGVSFCCYPGQADVAQDYWNHPKDLSGNNYLPYLSKCYSDYHALRWLLGQRFAGKAKVTYEFETFFNQSGYLYPAMARLFRALGSQIALMWQYTLSPAARYCPGSHYLNAETSPTKALSFCIASRVFGALPRYAEYGDKTDKQMAFDHTVLSQPLDVSIYSDGQSLIYSRSLDDPALALLGRLNSAAAQSPRAPGPSLREIVGCGRSPWVSYEGSGAYFLRMEKERIELRILPDVRYLRPLWDSQAASGQKPACELDAHTPHRFSLHLAGWEGKLKIVPINAAPEASAAVGEGSFEIVPGQYRISK